MQAIKDPELLELWETAASRSPLEKSLMTLAYACPEYDAGQLAALSIGVRDAHLLHVRELMFGKLLHNTAHCPACAQKVEWEMETDNLKMQQAVVADPATIEWVSGGQTLHFRAPNSADLLAIANVPAPEQAQALLQCCLSNNGALPEILPEAELTALDEKLSAIDPQADLELELTCPNCTHRWPVIFDITQYLWMEIQERALRLLQEVYLLASRFGWSERDILAMSRRRRNIYLNMLQA